MRSLSVSELLTVWERGWSAPPFERALALLSVAMPGHSLTELARVSLGRRDDSLLTLRERIFGSSLDLLAACPKCNQVLEMVLAIATLRFSTGEHNDASAQQEIKVVAGEFEIRCRLPNTEDLVACAGVEAAARRAKLFERCVIEAHHLGPAVTAEQLPDDVARQVIEEIGSSDPQADVRVDMNCPQCSHRWVEVFDIVSFLWTEIDTWARRTLADVHTLATTYGWRESDILALSPGRRQIYLTLAGA